MCSEVWVLRPEDRTHRTVPVVVTLATLQEGREKLWGNCWFSDEDYVEAVRLFLLIYLAIAEEYRRVMDVILVAHAVSLDAVASVPALAVWRKGRGKNLAQSGNGFVLLPKLSGFFPSLIWSVMLLALFPSFFA